jgi:hypothetical protein
MVAYQFLAKHIQILDQSVEVPRDTVIELIVLVFKTLNSEELNNLRHLAGLAFIFLFFFAPVWVTDQFRQVYHTI